MIYTINASTNVMFPVIKSCFELSDEAVYKMINDEHTILVEKLKKKNIKYDDLKRALIPNQEKGKNEVCFVFDTNKIQSNFYGTEIYDKFIPLLDKESTYSILNGDYSDILSNVKNSQEFLSKIFYDSINLVNETLFYYSNQYFVIYINSITDGQIKNIESGLKSYDAFTGYAILHNNSIFKSYLSRILSNLCIKAKGTVVLPHSSDYDDNENINEKGYHFEDNGFKIVSINDDYYGVFLSYKIESIISDSEDVGFSFNSLFPKFDRIETLKLEISDGKWGFISGTKTEKEKGGILKSIGCDCLSKEEFSNLVFQKICRNYLYNIRRNEHGDLMFNICIELTTVNENLRKTTIALKYHPDNRSLSIVTIT